MKTTALEGCSAAQAADTEDVAPAAAPAAGWRDVPRASWGPGMYATLEGEGPILFGRSIYASGYAKPLALLLACTAEAAEPPTHVFFIDDDLLIQRDLGDVAEAVAGKAGEGNALKISL